MGERLGRPVFLKMECRQPSGSFKIRGIGLLCGECVEAGASRLVCASSGNAGNAVAYAGRQLGVEVTIVVPKTTSSDVCRRVEGEGATVIVHGPVWDEANAHAQALAREDGSAYIPSFDHPTIWRGHATMVDELARQMDRPDVIVLSVGGGGLMCGVIEGLDRNGWADVPLIAVETEGTASLAASLAAGRLVTLDRITGAATSLGAKRVGERTFELARSRAVVSHIVSDAAATNACCRFHDDHGEMVEPACGASLSVVYDRAEVLAEARGVLVIVCGGICVSAEKLIEWRRSGSG